MFLGELEKPVSTDMISKVLRETFEFELSKDELTETKAKFILEDVLAQISDFRNTDQYFLGERNAIYLSMLATAKYLSEYIREKKPLLEKNPPRQQKAVAPAAKAAMYHGGIQKGIGHGADTARKFVPHVAGSAIGAFAAGLKGQALSSEHGQVKITDLEKELEMIDPKNPASVNKFVGKQMKEHFSQYKDPAAQKTISTYISKVYQAGASGTTVSPQTIEASLVKLNGNPFGDVTNPQTKKELVSYFVELNAGAKASAAKSSTKQAQTDKTWANTPVMKDVATALVGQGYKKMPIGTAILNAVKKNPTLANNFDGLFRAALAVIKK